MIKNEKQYNISKKRLAELELTIATKQPKILSNSKREGALNSVVRIKNSLKEEIKQYESLKTKGIPLRRKVSVTQLPKILIEHKIAKGLTQKQFSEMLGIKEQQLQRYEAENFSSVSFGRLMKYIELVNIKINLAVE